MMQLQLRGLGEIRYSYGLEPFAGGGYRIATWQCRAFVMREAPEHYPERCVQEIRYSRVYRNVPEVITGFVPKVPGKAFAHDYSKRTKVPMVGSCPILKGFDGRERATLMEIVGVIP